MNGIDGSNGQLDPSAFVALITPYVIVGDSGSILTFWASGGNGIAGGNHERSSRSLHLRSRKKRSQLLMNLPSIQ